MKALQTFVLLVLACAAFANEPPQIVARCIAGNVCGGGETNLTVTGEDQKAIHFHSDFEGGGTWYETIISVKDGNVTILERDSISGPYKSGRKATTTENVYRLAVDTLDKEEVPLSHGNRIIVSKVIQRIGIYDSRAIAVAFVGSAVYNATVGKQVAEKMAEYKKAQAEGNQQKLAELNAWGEAQQALLHQQGFSTAPVADILQHIAGQLPAIHKEADVQLLVSKWDAKTLQEHQSAQRIDLTLRLIEAFQPTEKQKNSAIEIQKHDPVPLETLRDHKP